MSQAEKPELFSTQEIVCFELADMLKCEMLLRSDTRLKERFVGISWPSDYEYSLTLPFTSQAAVDSSGVWLAELRSLDSGRTYNESGIELSTAQVNEVGEIDFDTMKNRYSVDFKQNKVWDTEMDVARLRQTLVNGRLSAEAFLAELHSSSSIDLDSITTLRIILNDALTHIRNT